MNTISWFCMFGTAFLFVWVTGLEDFIVGWVGLLSALFIACVLVTAKVSRNAKRAEEEDDIGYAYVIVDQCNNSLIQLKSTAVANERDVRITLDWVSSRINTLAVQYNRYLKEGATNAVVDTENILVSAQTAKMSELIKIIDLAIGNMDKIRNGIRNVDDPRLRAYRGKM